MHQLAHTFVRAVMVAAVAGAVVWVYVWFASMAPNVHAQSYIEASGYAWSDTIGWIHFGTGGGGSYGVTADSNGWLTGYAWSDTIGWIKLGGLSSFPTGSGTTAANGRLVGGVITGWARACAGTVNGDCSTMTSRTDGWDGWIALSGSNWGITVSGGDVDGWAWGGDVVGWIDMDLVSYNISAPTVTTYAQTGLGMTTATLEGGAVPNEHDSTGWFRYSLTNPGTCNDIFGTRTPASGGTALGSGTSLVAFERDLTGLTPSTTYYYCAIASNTGGTGYGEVRFFTTLALPQCADGIDNDGDGLVDLDDLGCTNSSDPTELDNPTVNELVSSALRVQAGQDVVLTWSGTELPATCELSSSPSINDQDGDNDAPRTVSSTPTGNATGVTVGPIMQTTILTVTCGATGVAQKTITIVPNIEEI